MVGRTRAVGAAGLALLALTASSPPPAGAPADLVRLAPPAPLALAPAPIDTRAAVEADLAAVDPAEHDCLAIAVYYESRGEPVAGQRAVAQVLVNRVESGRFAPTLCGVLRQPGQFPIRPGDPEQRHPGQWARAREVARDVMTGEARGPARALYFHAVSVRPNWTRAPVAAIGNHVFYR